MARLTARQLAEWSAFFAIEPLFDGYLAAGVVAAAAANSNPYRDKPARPEDYFPHLAGEDGDDGDEAAEDPAAKGAADMLKFRGAFGIPTGGGG